MKWLRILLLPFVFAVLPRADPREAQHLHTAGYSWDTQTLPCHTHGAIIALGMHATAMGASFSTSGHVIRACALGNVGANSVHTKVTSRRQGTASRAQQSEPTTGYKSQVCGDQIPVELGGTASPPGLSLLPLVSVVCYA